MRAIRLNEYVFDDLASARGRHLISVFLPTHKRSREVAQDRIRLKNLLGDADETLAEFGWKPLERSERLAKAHSLLDDLEFWEHQEAGLAVYIDDAGDVVPIATARPLETAHAVMSVFMLRPLAADLNGLNLPVLVLTRDESALFTANEFSVEEILADLPSYKDVNWFVDREKERQHHPDAVGEARNRHGHEPAARRDEDLARFLRTVDSAIESVDEKTTLITLGDDDLVSRFADLSARATLSPPNSGIRAPFSPHEVAEMVGTLIADIVLQRSEEAQAASNEQLALGMATVDIREAIPAAVGGRIHGVLVDRTAPPIWGRLDDESLQVEIHDNQEIADVDLLDRLVVWAHDTGAEILSTETMKDDRFFIATFRF